MTEFPRIAGLPAAGAVPQEAGGLFLAECATLLADVYLPRLRLALAALPPADLWWRPHAACTSVGNLLLHLRGNVQQWLVCGLGGAPDGRLRSEEFAARGAPGAVAGEASADAARQAAELLGALDQVVQAAVRVVRAEDPGALCRPVTIQGFATTRLSAILHVVEHFGWHAGQVTWMVKARAGAGHGLAFFDEAAVNAGRNPSRTGRG